MDNITITEETPVQEPVLTEETQPQEPVLPPVPQEAPVADQPVVLVNVPITDANVAFNVMISFLTVAQKRGAFAINESAKLWECLKFFLTPEQLQQQQNL
jgi:hypothetical protein